MQATTRLKGIVAAVLAASAFTVGAQASWPDKPIHFVFPSTAGGSGVGLMHVLAQQLSARWKQPVVVEPRPGANSAIGTDYVAKAAPDGYTILMATSQHVILHHSMPKLPYDAIRDFTPIAAVARMQYIMAANPKLEANTLKEFIALAKARPDTITFGSGGAGGPGHLAVERFMKMTDTRLRYIPYNNKGMSAVVSELIGGQIDIYVSPPGIGGHIASGKLKALAVSGDTRSPSIPNVPTFREAGLPDLDASAWYAVLGPANMPKAIVDRMAADIAEVMALPEVREKVRTLELEPISIGPAEFGAIMRADKDRYTKIVKDAGLVLGN
ncbi:MAG: tripartite tricarboxylate transporter substrate binding protein [Comamonadaceae bacterium]|nr:MAG: tripartite tricarboxylate transporter substrate binding protein [Comamonadaceae bacterium]